MTQREEFERVFLHSGLADRDKHLCKAFWNKGFLSGVEAAKAQAVPQWIPVSEQPPKKHTGDKILGFNGEYVFECICDSGGDWCNLGGDTFTHWMPLPAPPEQNK